MPPPSYATGCGRCGDGTANSAQSGRNGSSAEAGFAATDFPWSQDDVAGVVLTHNACVMGGPAVTDAIIVRYSRNGLLDGRFSNGGKHWTKLGRTVGADDDVIGCFIAADGDILVAGTHDGDFALGCFRAA